MKFRFAYDYDAEEAYVKTLEWVNKIRHKYDDPPLEELASGTCASRIWCSLALSIEHKATVDANYLYMGENQETRQTEYRRIRLPGYAKMFIQYFDNGWYPDLIQDRKPVA